MPWSFVLWFILGILLFWSVGAYNRMVRLRSATLEAFATLDAQLMRLVDLLQSSLPAAVAPSAVAQPGVVPGDVASLWDGLQSAASQFTASLAAARAHPLDGDAMAALSAAQGVLAMAWQRLQHEAHDLAGAAVPETLQVQWEQLALPARVAGEHFNLAVARYNEAIAQFPALLLARLFGFKVARPV
ncbi:MAG: LemA family protein [Burkholderiaceae bacterium]